MTVETVDLAPGYTISRIIMGGWQLSDGHGEIDRERRRRVVGRPREGRVVPLAVPDGPQLSGPVERPRRVRRTRGQRLPQGARARRTRVVRVLGQALQDERPQVSGESVADPC